MSQDLGDVRSMWHFLKKAMGIERSQPKIKVVCAVSDEAGEGRQTKTNRAPVIPPSQRPEEGYGISGLDIISFWLSKSTLMLGFSWVPGNLNNGSHT